MKANRTKKERMKILLIIMPIVIVALFIFELIYVNRFNAIDHVIEGADNVDGVNLVFAGQENSTSVWLKRGFDLYGDTVDLNAQTIDINMYNNSNYQLASWQMRVNIHDDCFINNMWCGKVEIHQDVNGANNVQTLDLRNYSLEDVELEYLYDGDLLIPLHDGDYLIYYPSSADGEYPLERGKAFTMGVILYYLEFPDLTDYQITFQYDRKITDDYLFYATIILLIVWAVMVMIYAAADITYRNTIREMEIKKSGILSMSDMYNIIYIIDLVKDELMAVSADEESEKLRPKNAPASEQLHGMFEYDCADAYKEMAYEFSNLETIAERLEDRDTVVFEYLSVYYGWCRIRFFAMDRVEGQPLEKVVFTIQEINAEKSEMDAISQRIDEAEHESKAKSTFLANMSHEIRTPINAVIGLNTMILRESREPVIKAYSKKINSAANMLLSLINGILDMSKLEADKMELVPEQYSLKQLVIDTVGMVKMRSEFERLELSCNISPELPDGLFGDQVRLKQIINNLLTNAAKYTDRGTVSLSIFGKNMGEKVHLLISVKDTGIGIREEDIKKLTERFSRFDEKRNHSVEGSGLGLNLVTGLLSLMGSELHVISTYGKGSEFYFEIDQDIVDESPVGKLDFNDTLEDTDYQALFTAPAAHILVVDDNEMNLSVFVDLLKETEVHIDTATSGQAAIDLAKNNKYDVIFMDHMMPGMDGIEAFHIIRDDKVGLNATTPVIVLTANAMKGAKEEYEAVGFDAFLAKPIQPDVLERVVYNILPENKVKRNAASSKSTMEEQIQLPSIMGVNLTYGLSHTGGMKSYLGLLRQFTKVADSELAELTSFEEALRANPDDSEALKSYRIKVHSMKASAKMMGALSSYGVAAMLEEAAMYGRLQQILEISPYYRQQWSALKDEVLEALPEEPAVSASRGKAEAATIESLLHLLGTSMKTYNISTADSIIEKLEAYEWSDSQMAVLSELKTAVANLDADLTTTLCEKLIKEV